MMIIDNNAWITLFDPLFPENEYIYHFTDITKATRILFNNSLKFSKICRTNDTLEAKPKIFEENFKDSSSFTDAIQKFNIVNRTLIQVLCFSRDLPKRTDAVSERKMYTDYSGRGFAFPRMWAQYSNNNAGVCFVFNKTILTKLIQKSLGLSLIHHQEIDYKSQFDNISFSKERILELLEKINSVSSINESMYTLDFLKNNLDFVKYNYFSKLDDWKGENEYRFLSLGDFDHFIQDIMSALVGVVVGENIEKPDLEIIKYFCEDNCEVKQITFTFKGCKLNNIY